MSNTVQHARIQRQAPYVGTGARIKAQDRMTALESLLATFRNAAVSEREKGTYFEELILAYLRNEATYKDLYSRVWTCA